MPSSTRSAISRPLLQFETLADELTAALRAACQSGQWSASTQVLPHLAHMPQALAVHVGFYVDFVLRNAPMGAVDEVLGAAMQLVSWWRKRR